MTGAKANCNQQGCPSFPCPDHAVMVTVCSNMTEKIESQGDTLDKIWKFIEDHATLLADVRQQLGVLQGKANGMADVKQAEQKSFDRALSLFRLIMYVALSVSGLILAGVNLAQVFIL